MILMHQILSSNNARSATLQVTPFSCLLMCRTHEISFVQFSLCSLSAVISFWLCCSFVSVSLID